MRSRNRLVLLLALALIALPFAACGTAEEPAEEPAQEEPAAEEEAPAEPEPVEPAPEEVEEAMEEEPQEPEIVGEIRVSGEDLIWGTPTEETAPYTWTTRVTNDTTATLDITVRFQLLDENDGVIKTETATIRLDPAQSQQIRREGSIAYDQANEVYGFVATTDFEIVEG